MKRKKTGEEDDEDDEEEEEVVVVVNFVITRKKKHSGSRESYSSGNCLFDSPIFPFTRFPITLYLLIMMILCIYISAGRYVFANLKPNCDNVIKMNESYVPGGV